MTINKKSKIFLAGHNGMVGSAILRTLKKKGYKNIFVKNKKGLDLMDQRKTLNYLKKIKPKCVIIAAAKVGGILANTKFKAHFIYQNLMIQNNLIHSSYLSGVKKLIFLGSSCIYPRNSKQPIKEKYLLTGPLEKTNDAYAIAKIAGVKMCEAYNKQYNVNYICLLPSNLYGPNDNYNSNDSHFFPALIKKIYNAKLDQKNFVKIWGNGNAKRELTFVDDLADACEYFLKKKTKECLINIGSGTEYKIIEYCKFIMEKMNYKTSIKKDYKMPNGTPRKLLDCKIARSYGWRPKYKLSEGFDLTFQDFLKKKIRL